MAGKHLAEHDVDDQERAGGRERDEVVEAPRELAVIARVVEHGAERRHDRERAARPECGGVSRIEDVGALEPAGEARMARGRALQELGLDVGHQDVVAVIERGRGQIAQAAADLEPPGADPQLTTISGDGLPQVERRRGEVGGDLVGGDAEVVVLDLPTPLSIGGQDAIL
jgi:hypothetical protein